MKKADYDRQVRTICTVHALGLKLYVSMAYDNSLVFYQGNIWACANSFGLLNFVSYLPIGHVV